MLVTLFGCSTTRTYIQVSSIAKITIDYKNLYILNNEHGNMIYKMWVDGLFGDETQPHLVDSIRFISIPVKLTGSVKKENYKKYIKFMNTN